jgi:uncharacterized protein YecT (DUF1311 family)
MRSLSILLLSLALAPPALADVDFRKDPHARGDIAVLSACFNAAETWEAAQDCVNLTFKGCIGRLGKSSSHADEGGCNWRELELWEHLLAIETRKLEAWTVLKDNEIAVAGMREAIAHDMFLAGQKAWETYQTAQCNFVGEQFAGGTARGSIEAHCQMDLVVERLVYLKSFLHAIAVGDQP